MRRIRALGYQEENCYPGAPFVFRKYGIFHKNAIFWKHEFNTQKEQMKKNHQKLLIMKNMIANGLTIIYHRYVG